MKDKLEILKAEQRMLKRKKLRMLINDQETKRLQKLDDRIKDIEDGVKDFMRRTRRVKNAREYWQKRYGQGQKIIRRFNKRNRPSTSASGDSMSRKRRKGNGGAANSGDTARDGDANDKSILTSALRTEDPIQALAVMGGVPFPGPIVLNDKTRLMKQIRTFGKMMPEDTNAKDDFAAPKEATSSFGYKQCQIGQGGETALAGKFKWKLKNFKTPLYNHQIVGVSWMVGRELSPHGPYGGIQSDAMGLGKTLEILACMTANPPTQDDIAAGRVATLIVVPASSVSQRTREILRHTNFREPFFYQNRNSKSMPIDMWSQGRDIV